MPIVPAKVTHAFLGTNCIPVHTEEGLFIRPFSVSRFISSQPKCLGRNGVCVNIVQISLQHEHPLRGVFPKLTAIFCSHSPLQLKPIVCHEAELSNCEESGNFRSILRRMPLDLLLRESSLLPSDKPKLVLLRCQTGSAP